MINDEVRLLVGIREWALEQALHRSQFIERLFNVHGQPVEENETFNTVDIIGAAKEYEKYVTNGITGLES